MSEKQVFGALICCTSGGVFKPSSIKLLIDCLAKMGYNQLEICMEDTYGIDGEPYFGYLRGGYSKQEMREVALYGQERGVEIVPAIQTLAHFPHLAKLPAYSDIFDVDDVLMIGDSRVYALIDRMFQTMREFFLTDQINIGFDEAYLVGLGKYLREHGYRDRFDLLMEHLTKVVAIAKEHGFKPHMWSDMFFRLVNRGEYYGKGISIPESVAAKIPEGLSLVYWDYFNEDESLFDSMVTSHEAMGAPIWYAGSAIVHDGFAPLNRKSLRVLEMAFRCLRRHSVHNFLITMWGDDGNECSFFAALPSLYAARRFAQGEFNLKVISEEFGKLFGFSFEDMLVLDLPNETASNPNFKKLQNPCKSLLYNDPFLGWKDYDLAKEGPIDFAGKAKALREAGSSVSAFSYLFETLASLCQTSSIMF